MLAPNQTLLLHDYFTRSKDLWLLCEQYDCDHDQMIQIIGAITPHLPGKGLDYNAILSNDPIACDHLVLHCQRSIGQLDGLYDRLISLFDSSSSHELQINKRTTVNTPPDWAKPSFTDGELRWDTTKGSEKIESTTLENKQRFRILESAMKCLERGLKMQITLTQRKEKLSKGSLNKEASSKEDRHNQNPRAQQDHTPFSGMPGLSGMQPYQGITGYNLDQLQSESTSSESSAPLASLRETIPPVPPQETNFNPPGSPGWLYPTTGAAKPQEASNENRHPANNHANNMAHAENPREEEPVTSPESSASLASLREPSSPASANEPGSPGWLYPTTRAAQPQEASSANHSHDNTLSHETRREEEPVNVFEFSVLSAPPCEPSPPVPEQYAIPKIPHPQYSAPSTVSDSDWQTYIPLGMDNGGEDGPMEEFIYPVFSHPYSEKEKVHYFPPFTEATPEDAEEIDAYLKSLPPEITADENIGSYFNAYLVAPVIRVAQSEAEHTIQHRRLIRKAARQQAHREQSPQLQLATDEAHNNNEPSYHQRE